MSLRTHKYLIINNNTSGIIRLIVGSLNSDYWLVHSFENKNLLSGGTGTGKIRLIDALSHQASCILQTQGQNPEHPSIQLTVPTGCAAFNTGGAILRSAWILSLKGFYSLKKNISLLATYQIKANMKILIIHEASMLGRKTFAYVHKHLQDTKNVDNTDSIWQYSWRSLNIGSRRYVPVTTSERI